MYSWDLFRKLFVSGYRKPIAVGARYHPHKVQTNLPNGIILKAIPNSSNAFFNAWILVFRDGGWEVLLAERQGSGWYERGQLHDLHQRHATGLGQDRRRRQLWMVSLHTK